MVSRYATWGAPTLHSTSNSRIIRSTMMSKWSSPIPAIIVWPDSSSEETLNDGSSLASLPRAIPIFSWSTLVLGSTATAITGSGNSILSRTILSFMSQRVSPVVTSLRPIAAAMSPALTSLISSRSLECIWTIRPMRSFLSLDELYTKSPDFKTPE